MARDRIAAGLHVCLRGGIGVWVGPTARDPYSTVSVSFARDVVSLYPPIREGYVTAKMEKDGVQVVYRPDRQGRHQVRLPSRLIRKHANGSTSSITR